VAGLAQMRDACFEIGDLASQHFLFFNFSSEFFLCFGQLVSDECCLLQTGLLVLWLLCSLVQRTFDHRSSTLTADLYTLGFGVDSGDVHRLTVLSGSLGESLLIRFLLICCQEGILWFGVFSIE
jgi:hypothetical protein